MALIAVLGVVMAVTRSWGWDDWHFALLVFIVVAVYLAFDYRESDHQIADRSAHSGRDVDAPDVSGPNRRGAGPAPGDRADPEWSSEPPSLRTPFPLLGGSLAAAGRSRPGRLACPGSCRRPARRGTPAGRRTLRPALPAWPDAPRSLAGTLDASGRLVLAGRGLPMRDGRAGTLRPRDGRRDDRPAGPPDAPRPANAAGSPSADGWRPAPRHLTLLLRPLLAHLVQLRRLAPDLLPLRLAHPLHPQVPSRDRVGRQLGAAASPCCDGRRP